MTTIIPNSNINGIYENGNFFPYKYIDLKSNELSLFLQKKNQRKRNIGIYIKNSVDYVVAYFAILKSNNRIVPIYREISSEYELQNEVSICDISTLIVNSDSYSVIKNYKIQVDILNINNMSYIPAVEKDNSLCCDCIQPFDILLQSSGTSNNPKRIMHSFDNIISNMKLHIDAGELDKNEKTLVQLPMTFSYCNTAQMLAHIYLCADIYIEESFSPDNFLYAVNKYNITNTTLVPTQLVSLSRSPILQKLNTCSLKKVFYGGSHLPDNALARLVDNCPNVNFINTYGQTEAGPRISINCHNNKNEKFSSAGLPLKNIKIDIRNIDTTSNSPHIGEIFVKTPCAMIGYYKNAPLTQKTIVDGWIDTGDLGYVDEDGYLYITGRKKNIIIVGGINVYPEEIENVLQKHPKVKHSYVYGESNPLLGEVVCARIECADNENISKADIISFCSKYLSSYKIPVKVYFTEISKTPNGKIKRLQS